MIWFRLAPYLIIAAGVGGLLLWLNNAAYNRGERAAQEVCAKHTVPTAVAENQARCDLLTKTTKEENDALSADRDRLRAVYDRLRKQKPIAQCLPVTGAGDRYTRSDAPPEPARGVGISAEWLDETFYDAARDIATGQSCQRQLRRIYELNNTQSGS